MAMSCVRKRIHNGVHCPQTLPNLMKWGRVGLRCGREWAIIP